MAKMKHVEFEGRKEEEWGVGGPGVVLGWSLGNGQYRLIALNKPKKELLLAGKDTSVKCSWREKKKEAKGHEETREQE